MQVNIADYFNGRTAIHCAAVNGHFRCVRLLFADAVPIVPDFWNNLRAEQGQKESVVNFDMRQVSLYEMTAIEYLSLQPLLTYVGFYCSSCSRIANKPTDGGITTLHMAALNGHLESVQLLLDLGANKSTVTVQDGSTIDLDLIGN